MMSDYALFKSNRSDRKDMIGMVKKIKTNKDRVCSLCDNFIKKGSECFVTIDTPSKSICNNCIEDIIEAENMKAVEE